MPLRAIDMTLLLALLLIAAAASITYALLALSVLVAEYFDVDED